MRWNLTTLVMTAFIGGFGMNGCASSPSAPIRSTPTVMVDNPLCTAAGCRTLEVRIFSWSFTVPQPIWGFRVLGEVHSPSNCLQFPDSLTFQVVGPSDTTVLLWKPSDAVILTAVDSALFHEGSTRPDSTVRGTTQTFTPGESPGWTVGFSGSLQQTTITPAAACK